MLFFTLPKVVADGGYAGQLIDHVKESFKWILKILQNSGSDYKMTMTLRKKRKLKGLVGEFTDFFINLKRKNQASPEALK